MSTSRGSHKESGPGILNSWRVWFTLSSAWFTEQFTASVLLPTAWPRNGPLSKPHALSSQLPPPDDAYFGPARQLFRLSPMFVSYQVSPLLSSDGEHGGDRSVAKAALSSSAGSRSTASPGRPAMLSSQKDGCRSSRTVSQASSWGCSFGLTRRHG